MYTCWCALVYPRTGGRERLHQEDIHDAVLLGKLLPPPELDELPLRLMDISLPLLDRQGHFIGVLATHLSLDWTYQLRNQLLKQRNFSGEQPMIQRILPGTRYSEAVIAGGFIFCAGMVPNDTSLDIQGQTADVLAQIDALLARCGTDKTTIVDTVIYLADMADYTGMNIAWDSWIAPGQAPARATVEARLANPAWRIEIKVTAFTG